MYTGALIVTLAINICKLRVVRLGDAKEAYLHVGQDSFTITKFKNKQVDMMYYKDNFYEEYLA